MHVWFMYLFNQRKDSKGYVRCYECNKPMHEDIYKETSSCYSHILGKKQYPDLAGIPENISICCPDCHNLYTMRPKKAVKQYAKAQYLLEKYDL